MEREDDREGEEQQVMNQAESQSLCGKKKGRGEDKAEKEREDGLNSFRLTY